MHEAVLYKKIENGVQCTACSWRCRITLNKGGICGMRINLNNKLFSLTYGRASAVNIDPIEKKPLYHFLPGKKILSIGSIGCNFGCKFCQNFDISQTGEDSSALREVDRKSDELSPEAAAAYCLTHKFQAVAFTYNEPVIWAEYAHDVMKILKPKKVRGVFVSNGYESTESLDYLDSSIDAYNIDLKGFSEKYYSDICGAQLKPVLKTISEIWRRGKWLEITTLLVPGANDSEKEVRDTAEFIASISKDIPWHLSAFFPTYLMADRAPTPAKTLLRAYELGKEAGLKYVYLGNTNDLERSATYCPKCDKIIIGRDGYELTAFKLNNGQCPNCNELIPGVWN